MSALPEPPAAHPVVVWHVTDRDGARLACADFGGAGQAVFLLHGLAGGAEEWTDTALALRSQHRVVAPDQRGHGRSERRPSDVSRSAYVDDVAMWIELLELGPTVVVGQSLGAHTAFLLAARYPGLIRAAVVLEATPAADRRGSDEVRRWLESWPRPFRSAMHATQFFGGESAWSSAWVRGLEQRDDGLWPRFDIDVMVAALREANLRSYWDEWERVSCPTLLVRGERGVPRDELTRMQALLPIARTVEIAGAGHDAHLDAPERWQACLSEFLETLE